MFNIKRRNIIKIVKNVVIAIILILGILTFGKKPIDAVTYNCGSLYCQTPGSYIEGFWYLQSETEVGGIVSRICLENANKITYKCSGSDAFCTCTGVTSSDFPCGVYAYKDQFTCEADFGTPLRGSGGVGCCGAVQSCIPSTSCSCNSPLSSTNQGNDSISVSCSNGCGGTASSTCYCPPADCADLDDQTTWYNTKQAEGDRESNIPVPVVPTPPDGCPETQVKTCYNTDNEKPTVVSVEVIPPEDKILGFSSDSYSGRGLDVDHGGGVNNPVGLTATYTDTDGQDDIQAIYIWWNPSDTKTFPTPDKLGTGEIQTDSNENFGFMISRDTIGGIWDKVYIPGEGNVFVQAGTIGNPINIEGPDSEYMVELNNISVTDSGTNEIQLELTMRFLTDTADTVFTDQYNIWAMANDYIGFTQFETDNKIKDYNEWKDSDEDWSLDMVNPPTLSINSISDTDVGEITVRVNAQDDDNISYVRLDACKSGIGIGDIDNLTSEYNNSYTLIDCDSFDSINNIVDIKSENSLLGGENHPPSKDYTDEITVYLNGNAEGSITFYLTVMDNAGNFDQVFDIYRLEQWAMVNNGFVYGKGGVTSSSRLVQAGSWGSHPLLTSLAPDMNEENADITNQVLMGGTPSLTSRLRELERYKENKSFKVAKYPGILMTTPYSELMSAYKQKAVDNNTFEYHEISDIPSNKSLSDFCPVGEEYCILETEGSLNIAKNFNCDGKGLIIAKGDITITPDLTSGDSIDEACIILSGGNINIKPGKGLGIIGDPPEYDEVHGYLIANGEIVIEKHSDPPDIDSSSNQPGLYVKGGLSAFTPNLSGPAAVYNEREIYFGHMGIYPVLVVDSNAKYGFLSTGVFGSQIDIFKLEIGFKPF